MLDYETALSYEHQVYPYDHRGNSEGEGGFSENFLVEEYALIDQVHLLGSLHGHLHVSLYPQLQDVDFRRTATRASRSRCTSCKEPTKPPVEPRRSTTGTR